MSEENNKYVSNINSQILNSFFCSSPGLEVYLNEKGRAVRTVRKFSKGDFVCEYEGELVNKKTSKEREQLYGPYKMCYMFYFSSGSKNLCIDATDEGKFGHTFGRLLNHSSLSPNVEPRLQKKNKGNDRPRLNFHAIHDIDVGVELLWDYGIKDPEVVAENPWLLL